MAVPKIIIEKKDLDFLRENLFNIQCEMKVLNFAVRHVNDSSRLNTTVEEIGVGPEEIEGVTASLYAKANTLYEYALHAESMTEDVAEGQEANHE